MKINIKNPKKIDAALDVAQHRCSARTIDHSFIPYRVEEIEDWLKGILYKKDWLGLKIRVHSAGGKMPASYRGVPECTFIILERCASGWFMVACGRTMLVQREQTIFPENLKGKQEQIMTFLEGGPL